ncbi:MAG: shikimate kinase [Candidatus Omnitrophica bacterium]|nr:shikimate kinase [Candidatus Omnitrophota bacterium]
MKNIYLVGFMGTGKSSVGAALAQRFDAEFMDMDTLIEERQQRPITDIFAECGEAYFRRQEKELLKEVSLKEQRVISCGGGIVIDPENIALMKEKGTVVCLTARPEVILARTRGWTHRPLLNVEDPAKEIARLLTRRAACYAQADVTIDTSELSLEEVVEKVAGSIG